MTATLPSTLAVNIPGIGQTSLAAVRLERTRRKLEADFCAFFRFAWEVLEPGRPLEWSWHYELFGEYATLIRDGEFRNKFPEAFGILLNVSPRTAKSTFWTVCVPVWCWLKNPARRWMCASYSADLASEHSVKRRDLITSPRFQELWGSRFQLKGDVNLKTHFDNDKTGSMQSTSVGGKGLGAGGDDLIVDDPLNAKAANSDIERKNANDWLDDTVRSRLNNPNAGMLILIMQRLNEMDPTGYLMAQSAKSWINVAIRLEAEEDERWVFPVSGRVYERKKGEVIQPGRFAPRVVEGLKVLRLVWAGQHQQRPAPLEGNMIKRADVRYYGGVDPLTGLRDAELPESFDQILVSADCAFKDLKTSDYVCVGTIGVKGPNRYILDLANAHLDEPATTMEIERQRTAHNATSILVEDKANGSAIIKNLRRKIAGVIEINPEGGKLARLFASSGEWQSGNWYVSRTAAWTEPFITQLITFPNAANDDMVDMMTQVCVWLQSRGGGMFAWARQEVLDQRALAEAAKSESPFLPRQVPEPTQGAGPTFDQLVNGWTGREA